MRAGDGSSGEGDSAWLLLARLVVGAMIPLVGVAVINAAGRGTHTELSDEAAREMQAAMTEVLLPFVFLAAGLVGLVFLIAIVPPVVGLLRNLKQYPVNTVAWSPGQRWINTTDPVTERGEFQSIDTCINCDLDDVRGHTIRFGTDRVLFGFVVSRNAVGEFDECLACRDADEIEYALRAEPEDPAPPSQLPASGGDEA